MTDATVKFGVWQRKNELSPEFAASLEALGYDSLWIGSSPSDDFDLVEQLLDATTTLTVATGIVNLWNSDPSVAAASYARIEAKHPGRFILGIGVGHPEVSGVDASKPYAAMVAYLDALDAGGVAEHSRVLAALGPRMLRLSAARARGAHPYLVTPEHTRIAREEIGPDALLVPEQRIVLEADPDKARALGRPTVEKPYLGLSNYRASLQRLGYTEEDLSNGGSDRLIDDLVAYGTAETVAAKLNEHIAAGADSVAVQLIVPEGADRLEGFARLAEALGIRPKAS